MSLMRFRPLTNVLSWLTLRCLEIDGGCGSFSVRESFKILWDTVAWQVAVFASPSGWAACRPSRSPRT